VTLLNLIPWAAVSCSALGMLWTLLSFSCSEQQSACGNPLDVICYSCSALGNIELVTSGLQAVALPWETLNLLPRGCRQLLCLGKHWTCYLRAAGSCPVLGKPIDLLLHSAASCPVLGKSIELVALSCSQLPCPGKPVEHCLELQPAALPLETYWVAASYSAIIIPIPYFANYWSESGTCFSYLTLVP
jgi:hypothetical protein